MAAIDWDMVALLAPELATVSEDAQDLILEHVNAELNVDMFDGEDGPTTRLARIYLACHLSTFVGNGANAGGIASESALGISRSYTQAAASAELGLSTYGQLYLSLAKTSFARLPVLI